MQCHRVQEKLSTLKTGYSLEEAQVIMGELRSIEESLRAGQKEKAEILHSLSMLGEDVAAIETEATQLGKIEKSSTACQTDFCGEVICSIDVFNSICIFDYLLR